MTAHAPTDCCDLVMKGGITSGVVYPKAVAKLARRYRLRNLGGTSAGAIAAGLAAAAEHGRASGGIDRLDEIPELLGRQLQSLFVPSARTRRFHRVLMAAIDGSRGGGRKLLHVMLATVASWPLAGLAGAAALGAFPLAALLTTDSGPWPAALWLLPLLLVGVLAGTVTALVVSLLRRLPGEGYGVYSGLGTAGRPGFTDWVAAETDRLAGLPAGGPPLTFGDLWGGAATAAWRDAARPLPDDLRPVVNLEMMTSDLTHGLALRVPFTEPDQHAFCPTELAAVFPARVMTHIEGHSRPAGPAASCPDHGQSLLLLPDTPDLPVVVAVRLSLSFPLLIAAVPLFRRVGADAGYERSWFSDGGISSNFPVHFFDRLWPRHPTFAIDLQPAPPDGRPFTPPSDRPDDRPRWPLGSVLTFVRAVFDTMQNWSDRGTAALPGYRDRVTQVHLQNDEGGLNLAMTADQIARLADAGADAVDCFLPERFPAARHRLVRFELATAKLHTTVGQLDVSWEADGWRDLIGSPAAPEAWAKHASDYVDSLLAGHRDGAAAGVDLSASAPKPEPDLRLTPHF